MVKIERVRYVNPHKGRPKKKRKPRAAGSRSKHRKRSRSNPGPEALILGFSNPTHKRSRMARPKRKRKGAKRHYFGAKHRKGNPRRGKHHSFGHRRRRRGNPGLMSATTSILKSGFYALIGLVVARQLPQWALGARNTGWLGYGANLAATIITAMIATKMFGQEVGKDVAIGGGIYTVNRVLQDQLSPVGKVLSISGLGDYNALGDIQPGYFPLPVPTDANGQPIIPAELRPAAAAVSTGGKGMSGISRPSRYANRF